jgi:hypothetical protein
MTTEHKPTIKLRRCGGVGYVETLGAEGTGHYQESSPDA